MNMAVISGDLPFAAYATAFASTACSAAQCLTVVNAVMLKQYTAVCAGGGVHLLIRHTGSFPLSSQPKSATFFFITMKLVLCLHNFLLSNDLNTLRSLRIA